MASRAGGRIESDGGGDLGLTTRYEYDYAFEVGKIDIAQPDVTMSGGLTELMRIAAVAKSAVGKWSCLDFLICFLWFWICILGD